MFPLHYQQKQPQNADASDLDYERKDLEKTNKKQYNELAQIIQDTLGQLITDKENFTIEKLSQKFKAEILHAASENPSPLICEQNLAKQNLSKYIYISLSKGVPI